MSVKLTTLYKQDYSKPVWKSDFWYNIRRVVDNKTGENADLINMEPDPADPMGFMEIQGEALKDGNKNNRWVWFANGIMRMSGVYPRIYLNYPHWKNVEITIYYKRLGISGKSSDGINVGARSHPLGHQSPENGKYYAETHTYYGRLRHDGSCDFAVEPHHRAELPDLEYEGTYRTFGGGRYRKKKMVFSGDFLPRNKWIGWKFVVSNLKDSKTGEDDKKVLLQNWIDLKSNGDPAKMSKDNWELVDEVIDEYGKIPGAPSKAYEIFGTDKNDIFNNEGICFLRSGFGDALYRDFSVVPIKTIHDICVKREPQFYNRDGFVYDYLKNIYNIFDYVITNALNVVGINLNTPAELDDKKD